MAATFCCVQCRLLQPQGTACAECNAPMIAPVELVRELLYYRDMRLVNQRDWGLVTAFLAGSSLALPVLAPFAVGSMIALGAAKWRARRQRSAINGVVVAPPPPQAGSTTIYGIARRFRAGGDVLLSHTSVSDTRGAVLVRRIEAQPFLLECADGPVLVTGAARLLAPSFVASRERIRRDDPRLRAMGVPTDFAIAGELEISRLEIDAAHVAVTGLLGTEAVADLAFHRDSGSISVLRGRPGAPVIVSDRRLVGVAL